MRTRALGPFAVSAIGLGCMPLSTGSRGRVLTEDEAVRVVHAALDAGVTLLDTADIYAPSWDQMGHNERIVARALAEWSGDRDSIVVATKGGITRSAGDQWGRDGSPEYLRTAVRKSLMNLRVDVIDVYQWHRPDRTRDYAEVVGTFRDLRDEGLVRAVGISNANVEEIAIAEELLGPGGLASVQNEFSPRFRSSLDELRHCDEHGIAFLPWSPLGGTHGGAAELDTAYPAFAEVADARGVSVQQVALAWELALSEHVVPIPGTTRVEAVLDNVAAVDLELTPEEVAALG